MAEILRVLLLEDSDEDAALVTRALQHARPGCEVQRVDGRSAFLAALRDSSPGLVVSDHRLGDFSGMHALEAVRAEAPQTPFIFVTGSLDEETAAECVKAGAWDYVIKDRLARLGPVVSSVLELRDTRVALARSQDQLRQTQKMDALGRLAGGVAHDYNNLMMVVLGYAQLLDESFGSDDPRRADLDQVTRAAQSAAALTAQLLAFSRKQVIDLKAVCLNDVLTGVERMLQTLVGEQVRLVLDRAPNLPLIRSDAGQLEQVIVNLAVNARDAMPHGGTLTISTAHDAGDGQPGSDSASLRPSGVRMEVRDTGLGIDPGIIDRIFEPFFTTKARGRGTGLGLATVYGIVCQSGGEISVAAQPGHGTVFTVRFPEANGLSAQVHPAAGTAPISLAGSEVILLVEDEPAIRTLARRVLTSYGYRVLDADTLRTALQIHEREPQIHLVLSDLVIPDGTGVTLINAIRADRPDVSVLLMSGYTDDDIAKAGVHGLEVPFLQKPITPATLVRRVREILNDRPAPKT
jgi:two-component system, cell cycle sensor histidine kinase and response regulator CckA